MDRLEAKEVHEQVDQAPSSSCKLQLLYEQSSFPSAPKLDSNLLRNSARARQRKVVR
jgi:hypothetical protein